MFDPFQLLDFSGFTFFGSNHSVVPFVGVLDECPDKLINSFQLSVDKASPSAVNQISFGQPSLKNPRERPQNDVSERDQ